MTWTFIYLMVVLKIPIVALAWIVWHAVKAEPAEPQVEDGGGGFDHPRPSRPRPPRRGPHGDPVPVPPARVRAVASEKPPVR